MNSKVSSWRWTRQRRAIVEALRQRKDHPTAEAMYHALREKGEDISLATVYRTLRGLAREGAVLELHGAGPDRFDGNTSPHYHFRCLSCGRVYDIDVPYRHDLDRVKLNGGFQVAAHQLVFEGLCPACQGTERDGG
ncbi:MAG: Fur family transcriptional regulator [Candidatus Bipolaricaulaceae bacterium]